MEVVQTDREPKVGSRQATQDGVGQEKTVGHQRDNEVLLMGVFEKLEEVSAQEGLAAAEHDGEDPLPLQLLQDPQNLTGGHRGRVAASGGKAVPAAEVAGSGQLQPDDERAPEMEVVGDRELFELVRLKFLRRGTPSAEPSGLSAIEGDLALLERHEVPELFFAVGVDLDGRAPSVETGRPPTVEGRSRASPFPVDQEQRARRWMKDVAS